ncbi:Integrin alpha-2 [Frankliniella fusca]|uniref:Integrin alpha-2 n=1 Tax=Frankliniella fusca TaxID=407009 RepID=A0AAE1HTM5_9NEOP|nr:Integrin alpha-2 [Frankliniella fusca]
MYQLAAAYLSGYIVHRRYVHKRVVNQASISCEYLFPPHRRIQGTFQTVDLSAPPSCPHMVRETAQQQHSRRRVKPEADKCNHETVLKVNVSLLCFYQENT